MDELVLHHVGSRSLDLAIDTCLVVYIDASLVVYIAKAHLLFKKKKALSQHRLMKTLLGCYRIQSLKTKR